MDNYKTRPLIEADIKYLIPVVMEWVRDRNTHEIIFDEVQEVRERMLNSLSKNKRYNYLVLVNNNDIPMGCMGIREPEDRMKIYKSGENFNTAELVNVFLSNKIRGKGFGRFMIENMFIYAKELGFTELIWNSGPRYKDSAWEFYNKVVGQPIEIAKDFYGESIDAPVWKKILI